MATRFSSLLSQTQDTYTRVKGNRAAQTHGLKFSQFVAHVEPANADGDTTRLMSVHSSRRIHDVLVAGDGAPGAGIVDLGVYEQPLDPTAADVGDVVDADLFGPGLTVAAVLPHASRFSTGALTDQDRGKQLWELLGLPEDPGVFFDIVATYTTGVDAPLGLRVEVEFGQETAS